MVETVINEKDAITITESGRGPIGIQPTLVRSNSAPGQIIVASSSAGEGILPTATAPKRDSSKARPLLDRRLLTPAKPLNVKKLTWTRSFVNTVKYSWLNLLLVFIPVSWACHFAGQSDTTVFVTSALAIVPCACLLSFATEELALRLGQVLGGLLNATFGNVVELIIAILALVKGQLRVVQSAMIGSILSNCLLVLGCAFCFGGLRFHEQGYRIRAAQVNINMLGLSVLSIVVPAAFHAAITSSLSNNSQSDGTRTINSDILQLSHGVAIILLITYVLFLVFQLWTHSYLLDMKMPRPDGIKADDSVSSVSGFVGNPQGGNNVFRLPLRKVRSNSTVSEVSTEADEEEPKLLVPACFVLLVVVTVITGFTAEWLVGSLEGLVIDNGLSEEFVALILLPIIGNAAEHVTAVTVSVKNKLDLSIQIAVGSSIQISLLVLPFLIILAWGIGQPLTLFFDIFQTVSLFLSIIIVNWAIQDGTTHWMEGAALIMSYVIIALSFFYYDP